MTTNRERAEALAQQWAFSLGARKTVKRELDEAEQRGRGASLRDALAATERFDSAFACREVIRELLADAQKEGPGD